MEEEIVKNGAQFFIQNVEVDIMLLVAAFVDLMHLIVLIMVLMLELIFHVEKRS